MGLAIAKEIVELHDGMIRAKSDDMRTQFIVDLPVKENENDEGVTDEIHTHRRRPFGGKTRGRKAVRTKADKGNMERSGDDHPEM